MGGDHEMGVAILKGTTDKVGVQLGEELFPVAVKYSHFRKQVRSV